MPKKIFIGGLSIQTTSEELQKLFAGFNTVSIRMSASDDGRSQNAFVEMTSDDDATAAIQRLNGMELNGRKIVVRAER